MLTIKKNKALVLVIGIALLLAVLISFIIFLSLQPKSNTWHEPRETDILLPEPACVKMYYGKVEYSLSQETQKLVYQTVSTWFDTAQECNRTPDEIPEHHAYVRFEFSFNGPYTYVGSDTEHSPSSERFVYSTISLAFACPDSTSSYHVYLTPHTNGVHFTTDNLQTSLMLGWQKLVSNQTFDNLVLTAMLNTPRTNARDGVVESNVFPAKPDSAVITQNGKSVLLTGEKLDELYQAFMQKTTGSVHFFSVFDEGTHSAKALNHTCVQFHYLKRQKYVPDTVPESGFSGSVTREKFYQGCEYDALLCIVEPSESYSERTHMIVDTYAKDTYAFSEYAWFIEKEFESYLEQLLN